MNERRQRLEAVFHKALESTSPADRERYLSDACTGELELRHEVEALLSSAVAAEAVFDARPIFGRSAEPVAATGSAEKPGDQIGRYRLLEKIGEGGMGVVYRAGQEEPVRRQVALKVIKLGMDSRSVIARFEAERQALALMDHPNIAKVFDGGVTGSGRPFFVMELVTGVPITEFCETHRLSTEQRLKLFIPVCQAIQSAHQKGIIHRDLKPSNVLVTLLDGPSAGGCPKVIDFGVAKALNEKLTEKTLLTNVATLIGTPAYMSPEQAEMGPAGVGDIDTRSDIYGLGVLLYELLTGTTPFPEKRLRGVAYRELQRIILEEEPERPSTRLTQILVAAEVTRRTVAAEVTRRTLGETGGTGRTAEATGRTTGDIRESVSSPRRLRELIPQLKGDLDWIVMKCLEKDRARRYETANALAADILRFLNDEPILARPVGLVDRTWRWCRRKPVVASLTASSALLLLAVAMGGPIAALRINQARRVSELNLYAADMRLASEAVHEGAFNHARELLEQHRPGPGAADLRGFEWRYLRQAVRENEPFRTLDGLPAPSGWEDTRLYRSEHFLYNKSLGQLKAWDMTTWEPVPIVPPPLPASVQWRWDPSRESAYAVDQTQNSLTVHTLPKFESGPTLRFPGPISVVTMSQDRRALAVGFEEGVSHRVLVWDLAHDARIGALGDFEATVSILTFSRDGSLLAAGSTNGIVGIWDLKTLQPLPVPAGGVGQMECLEFTPDNKRLVSGNAKLTVWDIGSRRAFNLEHAGRGDLQVFGFPQDAMHLVVSWGGYDLALLDSQTLLTKGTLRGHRGRIGQIAFSPDGQLMASASTDQTARIWDLATQTEVGIAGGFDERICDVQFSTDGRKLVLISGFGQVRVHPLSAVVRRGLFATIPGQDTVNRLRISPDERKLATISVEGTLALWDRRTRNLIRSVSFPRRNEDSYAKLCFSPDGERLAWVTGDALRVMLVESGEVKSTAIDGNHESNSVAFSPDGRELAFGCGKQVLIHELASGRQQRLIPTDDEVFAITYSPDGSRLAFGDRQGAVTLCERAGGRVLSKQLKAHPPHVYGVVMSPDGRLLATCGADATIKLWRVESDGLHFQDVLRGHMGFVCSVNFSPDGTRLVSASGDQTIKVWDAQRAVELATLYGHRLMAGSVEFTKDGRTLYSAGFDGEIRFWEAPPFAEFDLPAKNIPIRSGPAQTREFKSEPSHSRQIPSRFPSILDGIGGVFPK